MDKGKQAVKTKIAAGLLVIGLLVVACDNGADPTAEPVTEASPVVTVAPVDEPVVTEAPVDEPVVTEAPIDEPVLTEAPA